MIRILFIDEHYPFRKALGAILNRADYSVLEAVQ